MKEINDNKNEILDELDKVIKENKETKDLEKYVEAREVLKKKVKLKKGISNIIESVTPLSHIFVAATFAFLYPYKRDEDFYKREYLKMKTVIDNTGVIEVENQFDEFNQNDNILYYYGKWEKSDDGKFTRAIKVYNLKSTKYGLNNILNGKVENLDEVFGNPISNKIQQKSTISMAELEKEPYLKAILYNESTKEYETRLIPVKKFSIDTIFTLLSCLSVEAFMYLLIKHVKDIGKPTKEVIDQYYNEELINIIDKCKKEIKEKNNLNSCDCDEDIIKLQMLREKNN